MLALSIACTLAAVAWIYLLAGHGGYWRTTEWLPRVAAEPDAWPDVVAVVPARNEAEMLPVTLPALLGQDYPGPLTVIVVDDGSSDGTGEVAARIAGSLPGSRTLRVIPGAPPPEGERWAGKVWAMAQGLRAAGSSDYVVFTDADIAWEAHQLRRLVAAAEGDDRDLVSQMALLRATSGWEHVVVPAFVYFFAQLYPFRRVNAPGSRTAAAAGGCMLIRRETLDKAGGVTPIRGALIDDVAMGRLIKSQRGRTWLGVTRQVVSVRPYPGLASLWQMVARSAYTQLLYSPLVLAGTLAGLLFLYLLPPAGAVTGLVALLVGGGPAGPAGSAGPAALAAGAGLAGWTLMSLSYLPLLRLYRLSPLRAPGLPLIALLYAAMTADSARRYYAGRGAEWRGRTNLR
jgi:hopene-associated glycosyltransferase HpnB